MHEIKKIALCLLLSKQSIKNYDHIIMYFSHYLSGKKPFKMEKILKKINRFFFLQIYIYIYEYNCLID